VDTTKTITHLSLCAGYGGIDLGLRSVLPRLRTCTYVEIEAFPCANLVAKMQEGWLDAAPIWTNLKTFDARPFRGQVDILSGGFPCQPFSGAGKQKSTDDPRHLFPEIERIIRECEPRMLFLENVEGIISSKYGGTEQSVLHYVLGRLESMGYRAEAGLFSAEECLYPHRRKRIFIAGLANTYWDTCRQGESRRASGELREESEGLRRGEDEGQARQESRCCCSDGCAELADTKNLGHSGGSARTGREGSEGECNNGDEVRCETEHVCELGNATSDRLNTRQSDTEVGGLDGCCSAGRLQKPSGGCAELADTDFHRREGRDPTQREGATSEPDHGNNLWGKAVLSCRTSTIPSRPGEPQHYWEAPRTIGDEEIVESLGGSTYGSADGNVVRNQRIDSLRALGNGVVPATAARAFVTLMDRLGGQP